MAARHAWLHGVLFECMCTALMPLVGAQELQSRCGQLHAAYDTSTDHIEQHSKLHSVPVGSNHRQPQPLVLFLFLVNHIKHLPLCAFIQLMLAVVHILDHHCCVEFDMFCIEQRTLLPCVNFFEQGRDSEKDSKHKSQCDWFCWLQVCGDSIDRGDRHH